MFDIQYYAAVFDFTKLWSVVQRA